MNEEIPITPFDSGERGLRIAPDTSNLNRTRERLANMGFVFADDLPPALPAKWYSSDNDRIQQYLQTGVWR